MLIIRNNNTNNFTVINCNVSFELCKMSLFRNVSATWVSTIELWYKENQYCTNGIYLRIHYFRLCVDRHTLVPLNRESNSVEILQTYTNLVGNVYLCSSSLGVFKI